MKQFSTLFLFFIASCGTIKEAKHDVYLNKKFHIDATRPIDYSIAPTRTNPLIEYFSTLDSSQKEHFLDSLKQRIDSIEFFRTHRPV